ncbi:MAG: DASS family sodium-coupled anion symporter, partial [Myxococcales bacterium]|nr:DASS family sodium-coupled anion symporter [Myxococcales bacterium]
EPLPGEGFERGMRRIGLYAGPIAAALAYWASRGGKAPAELPALMALAVVWWMTEALPAAVVSLVVACGTVLTGVATAKVAFGAFGYPLLFLFVGSFFIAEAMKAHGLGERLAATMTSVARTRRGLLAAVAVGAFALSLLMSNSASTAIILPVVIPIAVASGDRRFGAALILSVAWGASVGGIGTPVGTPPNLIGLGELRRRGLDLDFLHWMAVGVPLGLIMLAGMIAVLWALLGVRQDSLPEAPAARRRPWSTGERSVVIAVALAMIGWLLPTFLTLLAPDTAATHWVKEHLREEVVAVLAGCSLFVLPGGRAGGAPRPALTWPEAVRIDWGVIMLFAGGVLLGDLARTTGLSAQWGRALVDATGASSTWSVTALVTGVSILLSEATSNTATATLMVPIAADLAIAAHGAPFPAVLGATLGSSFGFMLPISTGPNAMAYSTGRVTVGQMVKAGVVFDVVGFVVIVGGLRVLCPLLGLA